MFEEFIAREMKADRFSLELKPVDSPTSGAPRRLDLAARGTSPMPCELPYW
jgi:hypothetical protein